MTATTTFAIAYSPWFAALATVLGTGPRRSRLEVDEDAVVVQMGWAFAARIARRQVVAAAPCANVPWAIGVHTAGRGDWIVNGTCGHLVQLALDPPAAACALGRRVLVRRLRVSVDRPAAFLELLGDKC
ncbi:MAG: hypothetical protein M0004_14720 [Actinomycetota bacterium]|nr:hypothetical protein [Actinomycetota bacterium]